MAEEAAGGSALAHRLLDQIRQRGPLRFDAVMQAALYDPEHGFYSGKAAPVRTGEAGDFVTAPGLSPVFASAFARFAVRAWRRLGSPRDWLLVEPGGGTGVLSAGVVGELERLEEGAVRGLRALLVDASPAHRAQAKKNLKRVLGGKRVNVQAESVPLDAPAVVLVNELLDNLPVRLLRREDGRWWERVVTGREGALVFDRAPAEKKLVAWVESFDVPVPDGHQVEVPVGAREWLAHWAGGLAGKNPVVMALVDYGETARDLLGEPRPQGTLLAYEGHARDRDVLARPGMRDITAHVNWSAVARDAREAGWSVSAFTDQFAFLSSFGVVEEAVRSAQEEASPAAFERLSALKEVLLPGGMGEAVKVLVLTRNLEPDDGTWIGLERTRDVQPAPRRPGGRAVRR